MSSTEWTSHQRHITSEDVVTESMLEVYKVEVVSSVLEDWEQ